MSKIDDGGPAYPVECQWSDDGVRRGLQTYRTAGWETGMSLRQWYAGHALAVVATRPLDAISALAKQSETSIVETIATLTFQIADAMIAEDTKSKGDA